ncbi:MAG: hypothetical protein KGQ37_01720 [Hyphomicrobiales bacterium]|nr:hypothetical protein [Hyphomicrobiales bacterium]
MNLPRPRLFLLLDHEFRLWRRRFSSVADGNRPWYQSRFLMFLGVVYVAAQAGDFLLMWSTHATGPEPTFPQLVGVDLLIAAFLVFVTITELSFVIARAYTRGEADLLYAAPIPPHLIFASRLIRGALGAAPTWLLLLSPVVNGYIVFDGIRYVSIYVTIFLVSGLAHIIANLLLLGMYRVLGPRHTKSIGNFMAGVALLSFIFASQFARFPWGLRFVERLDNALTAFAGNVQGWPLAPARALLGSFPDMIILATLGMALVGIAVLLFSNAYERMMLDCGQAHGEHVQPGRTSRQLPVLGLRLTLLRKEFAAMRRNPTLWVQLLSSTAYVIPAGMSLGRSMFSGDYLDPAIMAGMLAFMSVTTSSPVMQLVFLNENAPELMATAPIPRSFDLGCKWQISALFTLGFLCAPLALVAWLSPLAGLAGLLFCIVGIACHAIVYISFVDQAVPYRNSKKMHLPLGAGLLTILLAVTLGGLAFTTLRHSWFALVPLLVLLVMFGALVPTPARRRLVMGVLSA